ncbi:hypothetical protein [Streptococcus sanguinis]|uniref:Uncharacterized protein n=1 Tax=Streptococcus sanguinis TaxID=1305 RepID=A0A0B7GPS8_STRSA|nr:hypothetical protein [Streptococcus sanguinis]CEL90760.1 conserved protein of unknown function [Streptococcus sanguinis]
MKLNKKFFIFIFCLILTSVASLTFFLGGNKKEYAKSEYCVEGIQLFNKDKYVLVGSKENDSFRYSQNYITDFKYNSLDEYDSVISSKVNKEEYFKIKIYNLHDSTKITSKEVDIYSLLGQENTYRLKQIQEQFSRDGKEYLSFSMYSNEGGKIEKTIYVILSLDTGKIEKKMSEKEFNLLLDQKNTRTYMRGTMYKSMDLVRGGIGDQINNTLLKYGMEYVPGYIIPSYKIGDSVEVSDTNFAKLYPEIAKKMRDMNKIYFRPDQYNEEEWFNDLIHWFAPEGQEVMELYATDETTGEKTKIRSFSDFKKWVETHPQKEK